MNTLTPANPALPNPHVIKFFAEQYNEQEFLEFLERRGTPAKVFREAVRAFRRMKGKIDFFKEHYPAAEGLLQHV